MKKNHFSTTERQQILDDMITALRKDRGIAGLLLVGSGAEGFADIYSDIDLAVVVEKSQDVQPLFRKWEAKLKELLPVFFCGESVRGPNIYLMILLLDNFLEVNISFQCIADLRARRGRWKTVFDDTGRIEDIQQASWANQSQINSEEVYNRRTKWIWHYIMHATVAVQRGQLWRAIYELEQVRNQILELRGQRDGLETKRFRYVDQMDYEFLSRLKKTLVTGLDVPEIMRALRAATECFFEEAKYWDRILERDLAIRFENKLGEYLKLFE